MSDSKSMKDTILDAAEKRVRRSGFSNMSFRDVAQDVGIKSASVHYHFPKKQDLGVALVDRYMARFETRLTMINQNTLEAAIEEFVRLYAEALVMDESICLCAALGAEAMGIDPGLRKETGQFFKMNIEWLENLFAKHPTKTAYLTATEIVATLQGAMILSATTGQRMHFDDVANSIIAQVSAEVN